MLLLIVIIFVFLQIKRGEVEHHLQTDMRLHLDLTSVKLNKTEEQLRNAGFNSTCYHPPRAHPRGFAIFFLLGGLFPTPGHAERDNSRPPGLFIDHKYVVLSSKLISVQ